MHWKNNLMASLHSCQSIELKRCGDTELARSSRGYRRRATRSRRSSRSVSEEDAKAKLAELKGDVLMALVKAEEQLAKGEIQRKQELLDRYAQSGVQGERMRCACACATQSYFSTFASSGDID